MVQLSLDDRVIPSLSVVFRDLDGEAVILDLRSGCYFGLNGVGTRTWALIAQGGSLREVNAALGAEFDGAEAVIEREVLRFAGELCAHGLATTERGEDG
jgi:hypothetical protein